MSSESLFDDAAQRDLLSAAVRLYEADMHDLCIVILDVLIACGNREAHILYGHCLSERNAAEANRHYATACDLGSAVGCYNLYLSHAEIDGPAAAQYLARAVELGWEEA